MEVLVDWQWVAGVTGTLTHTPHPPTRPPSLPGSVSEHRALADPQGGGAAGGGEGRQRRGWL